MSNQWIEQPSCAGNYWFKRFPISEPQIVHFIQQPVGGIGFYNRTWEGWKQQYPNAQLCRIEDPPSMHDVVPERREKKPDRGWELTVRDCNGNVTNTEGHERPSSPSHFALAVFETIEALQLSPALTVAHIATMWGGPQTTFPPEFLAAAEEIIKQEEAEDA